MEQQKVFELEDDREKVYKLKKALYGLRQAPSTWYRRVEDYYMRKGFKRCYCEHSLFIKSEGGKKLIVSLYVNDLIYTSDSDSMLSDFIATMEEEFSMTDLGMMRYFFGVEVI